MIGLLGGCGGSSTSPSAIPSNVAGTWNAHFEGTVQGTGTRQDDDFIMDLQQSGSKVTGTVRISTLTFGLTGSVTGRSFNYTITGNVAPNCAANVTAQTTVNAAGTGFSGSQTQTTCEGTATGQVSATKR
jgi:hypothetical protein